MPADPVGWSDLTTLATQDMFDHPLGGLAHALARFVAMDAEVNEIIERTGKDPDDNTLVWARDDEGVDVARILVALLDVKGYALTKPDEGAVLDADYEQAPQETAAEAFARRRTLTEDEYRRIHIDPTPAAEGPLWQFADARNHVPTRPRHPGHGVICEVCNRPIKLLDEQVWSAVIGGANCPGRTT